jgi:hypothetical protein
MRSVPHSQTPPRLSRRRLVTLALPAVLAGCLSEPTPDLSEIATRAAETSTSRPPRTTDTPPPTATPEPPLLSPMRPPSTPVPDPAQAPVLAVTATIDPNMTVRGIDSLIYGMAWEDAGLRPGLRRWGGNFSSRYNWELGSAFNVGADWEFRNINYGDGSPAANAPSGFADQFIAASRQAGTPVLLTVPALGWVARDDNRENRSWPAPERGGPSVADPDDGQGAIDGYDPGANRARTSVRSAARKGAPFRFPPDLNDGVVYQDEWVAHLVQRFGRAADGGVRFYAIDNEPDLWSHTHRDIHPAEMSYEATLSTFLDYASAIKAVDPTAEVVGPILSGWTAINYSALDRGADNFRTAADRRRHGDLPFLPWFLRQVREHDQQVGRRTLDVVGLNWYPQGGEYPDQANDPALREQRLRATRQLWDPLYGDESWMARTRDIGPNAAVRLIPRVRAWIDQHYPGTKLGITEWNYGADGSVNGALAIAEALGVFGREGVDLAAYWRAPKAGSPGALAFKLFLDFDGRGGRFGDWLLSTTRGDRLLAQVSLFAGRNSRRDDLTLLAINKDAERPAAVQAQLTTTQGWQDRARLYRYGGANPDAIASAGEIALDNGLLRLKLPPASIALAHLPAVAG